MKETMEVIETQCLGCNKRLTIVRNHNRGIRYLCGECKKTVEWPKVEEKNGF